MTAWLDFDSCLEVDEQRIDSALAPVATVADALPREKVFALLDRMAEIAKPRQGAPRILLVIARLASCDWIEGDIEVRLYASGEETGIDLLIDDGMLRSRLRPSLVVAVPFEEFEMALGRNTEFMAPLQLFELIEGKEVTLGVDSELEAVEFDDGGQSKRRPRPGLVAAGVKPAKPSRPRPPPVTCGPGEGSLPPSAVALAKALNVPRAPRTPTTSDNDRAQTPSPQQARVGGASRLKQTQIVVDAREVSAIDVSDDEPTLREIAEPIANDGPPPVLPTSNALIDDDEPTLRRMPEDLDEGR